MKYPMVFKRLRVICFSVALLAGGVVSGQAVTSPSSLIVKVFEMRVSKNSDCSGAVTVFKTASASSIDLVGIPTMGSGSITDGTYHCAMFHISDFVTVTPQVPQGSCVAGPNAIDIFINPVDDESITPEGTLIHGSAGEDDPWIYFSDSASAASVNDCFQPTTQCACSGPCPLTPMTLAANQTHTLVFDLDSKIDGSGGTCALLLPHAGSGRQTVLSIR